MNHVVPSPEPPIVELVICAQFAHLSKLTTGHYGRFWSELGEDWVDSLDGPQIDDRFEIFPEGSESFQSAERIRITPVNLPGRIMFVHKNKDLLLQIQGTRFLLNWRKSENAYPSYELVKAEFKRLFELFINFCDRLGIGRPLINQWELTYVNSFPKNQLWTTPNEWNDILPGIFSSLFTTNDLAISLEQRAAQWSFEIAPQRGRLHLNAHAAQIGPGGQENLLMTMTARGPVSKKDEAGFDTGLELGHRTIIDVFSRIVNPELKQKWGLNL